MAFKGGFAIIRSSTQGEAPVKLTLKQTLVAAGTATLLGSAIGLAVWSVNSLDTQPAPRQMAIADAAQLSPGPTVASWDIVFKDVR
jgi:hypothetical protein